MNKIKLATFGLILSLTLLVLNACALVGQSTPVSGLPTPNTSSQNGDLTVVAPTATTVSPAVVNTDVVPTSAFTATLPPAASLTVADLKNATYRVKDLADLSSGTDSFTLTDGQYALNDPALSTDQPVLTVQYQQSAIGDLNGDGIADAAVILVANTGGSGSFEFLAAMVQGKGVLENVDTISLGDRVIIESLAIQDGSINLQMVTHGPQDPMCCPSLKTSATYLLVNGRLFTQAEMIATPLANGVIQALQAKDMAMLDTYIDPSVGVRFSPYTNVKEKDLVFTPAQLTDAFTNSTVYIWGNFDGSCAPIQLTFSDYYARFVYNQDFASSTQIGYNQTFSSGNLIDNSRDFYPNAIIVEFYLPGTNPDYGGMDWQSLKLVFQQIAPVGSNAAGQWVLVGIIHNQWTI